MIAKVDLVLMLYWHFIAYWALKKACMVLKQENNYMCFGSFLPVSSYI